MRAVVSATDPAGTNAPAAEGANLASSPRFQTTSWQVVLEAGRSGSPGALDALYERRFALALLEQVLTPEQFAVQKAVVPGKTTVVDFAVKFERSPPT